MAEPMEIMQSYCLEGSDPGEVGFSFEPGVTHSCDKAGESGKAGALCLLTFGLLLVCL